ncbi:hypothetical protein DYB25_012781 [Aphanomyces astaci]|uniref:Uncharacterized protein n=1 Tax=Aphanomyces astaci TaxID=112090 RepID=A0A397BJQ5_APHAT|nr:hypothetical protein DYB25_012781 [Aphanomyces astaci]
MSTLDTAIAARFADKACVLDCGLFDAIQKTHQKPLVQDTFAGQYTPVTSLPFKRGAVPSMHAMFVATSTVSAWLALHESHVVIILAPNLEQMSLYLACAALYRAPFSSDLMPYGERILQWLAENVDASESLAARLSKTFADLETRNTTYIPGLPRPQVRFLQDFAALLILRDKQLMASVGRQVHTGDLHLHMYHVPVNSRGQIVLESRLNCSLLFEHLRMDDRGEVVYGINAEAFAAEDEAEAAAALADAPTRAGRAPSNPNIVLAIPRANLRRQLVPEEAMIVSSVTVADAIVYSSVGDVHLKQVDVCQRSGVVYLQFHVQCGDGQLRVLTTNQLFGYSLPAAVLTTLTEVGALELVAQMPQFDPSNSADSFDEQYGLWLQRQFDDDISRLSTQIRIGTTPTDIENLVAQHGALGWVVRNG